MKYCTVDKCVNKAIAKGLCSKHYQRVRRHGHPNSVKAEYGIYKDHHYEAQSYLSMIRRCSSGSNPSYSRYGGAHIQICKRWLGTTGFKNFLKDMGKRPKNKTIDRIDNNKGYSPDNCRWASISEQNRNRKTNLPYTYNGQTMVLTDWAKIYGLRPETVYVRYHKGERGIKLFRPSQKK